MPFLTAAFLRDIEARATYPQKDVVRAEIELTNLYQSTFSADPEPVARLRRIQDLTGVLVRAVVASGVYADAQATAHELRHAAPEAFRDRMRAWVMSELAKTIRAGEGPGVDPLSKLWGADEHRTRQTTLLNIDNSLTHFSK